VWKVKVKHHKSNRLRPLSIYFHWVDKDPASSTTKTGRHDIAEILLKVALYTINQTDFVLCRHTFIGSIKTCI